MADAGVARVGTDDGGSDRDAARRPDDPGRLRRVGFWLFLGLASTAFAEVPFPNTPFDPVTMVLFAVPVYSLHAVVLAGLAFRTGRVTFPTLYLSGVVLGLYEAYVTKVVWAPVGDPLPVRVAGVYPLETASLVLFWHPVVSFLLPVTVVEAVATSSRRSLVPPLAGHRYAPHLGVALVGYLALFHGVLGGGPVRVAVADAVALAVLFGILWGWRATGGHRHAMATLLPTGGELWLLGAALVAIYPVFGAALRPGALPAGPVPHLAILAVYVAVGGALVTTLRSPATTAREGSVAFTWPRALTVAGAFALAALGAAVLLRPLATVVFLSYFALGPAVGVASLTYAASGRWRRRG